MSTPEIYKQVAAERDALREEVERLVQQVIRIKRELLEWTTWKVEDCTDCGCCLCCGAEYSPSEPTHKEGCNVIQLLRECETALGSRLKGAP